MIRLIVDKYCENCPEFKADIDKKYLNSTAGTEMCNTEIRCKHRYRCEAIAENIKNKK